MQHSQAASCGSSCLLPRGKVTLPPTTSTFRSAHDPRPYWLSPSRHNPRLESPPIYSGASAEWLPHFFLHARRDPFVPSLRTTMRNSPQGNHPGNGTQSQYHRRQQPHHGYQHQQQISGIKDDFRNYISSCYDHIAHAKRTGLSINYELEFRFGDPLCRAHASGESDHRVETGVRRHIFLRAQERLADYFHRTDVFNDRYTKNHLRYRFAVCGDEYLPLVVIHKRQVSFKLIHGLAVKAVLSDEQVVNNAPFPIQANQIDFTRDKVVHTYLLGGNCRRWYLRRCAARTARTARRSGS
ncbi:uncharacterized protein BJ171DRAFT_68519 [Polychytrium aggregatum]|uniref:uncharacterized protein n=1 Tax=Polychytrium aggregatum TaxID=110093 RepID=UPI0022FF2C01|nr:uncharacterized protein BJ171DRAFT_68519 [Polychytrium aggregatum]KAI9190679.1 hypothetical protein BJ171DRAFT_68519 [Polychytrium aggregatum]